MVMKDKLVKFNKKAMYYRTKKLFFSFLMILGMGMSVAIPLAVDAAARRADALNDSSETSEEISFDTTVELLVI